MSGPSAQDSLPLFSHAETTFPVVEYEVVGGLRDHVHEYSHQDGGDPEKLGRKLYVIRATINAQATFPQYPGLWPQTINQLMSLWETGAPAPLVVPDISSSISAYAYGWTRKWTAKVRSGISCTVEFREDKTNLPLPITVSAPSPKSMAATADNAAAIAAAQKIPSSQQSLVASLGALVSSIQGIQDTVYLLGNQVLLQCQQLIALCQQVDQLSSVQNPNNVELMRAVHQLWAQAQAYANDIQQNNAPLTKWIVPAQMTIGGVSSGIFGDSTHVNDLLALNTGSFNDPNQIPAGTIIVYYPPTQNASTTAGGLALGSLGVPH
jgi:hypothetical protein